MSKKTRTENTMVCKLKKKTIEFFKGDYVEAVKHQWNPDLSNVPNLKYLVIVLRETGRILGVLDNLIWEKSDWNPDMDMVTGNRNSDVERFLCGKRVNKKYRKQGARRGFIYAHSSDLLELA